MPTFALFHLSHPLTFASLVCYAFPMSTSPARATLDAKTLAHQDAFLYAFARCGTIKDAAAAAQISSHETPRYWLVNDVLGFKERFRQAQLEFAEYLESLALQRVEAPTFNGRIGSDVLLMGMLNANHPTKWRRDTVIVGNDATRQLIDKLTQLAARQQPQIVEGSVTVETTLAKLLPPGDVKPSTQE